MDEITNAKAEKAQLEEIDIAIALAKIDLAIAQTKEDMSRATVALETATGRVSAGMKKRLIATIVAMSLLISTFVLCTFAYFTASTSSQSNHITTGTADVTLFNSAGSSATPGPDGSIPDTSDSYTFFPGKAFAKEVYAKNNGAYPLYIRAKIDTAITLAEKYSEHSDKIDLSLVIFNIDTDNWTEKNGFYYYNKPIYNGETTAALFTEVKFSDDIGNFYKDSTVKVDVLLEAVQANNNGQTVFEAVGWASSETGGAS